MRINILLFTICFFAAFSAGAQRPSTLNPQLSGVPSTRPTTLNYKTLPIRLPLSMSGNFAEIRPNHFHSGIDIRTEGEEGKPIYAPADGYVSRINISAWGGGRVLYITHPDGYRTVYMHLSAFCGKIGEFVHNYQYNHKLYAFDTELPKDSIKVKKGDIVALSGNSGGSMGPHLHYEIRFADNDQTINALYFGLPYSDNIAPTIAGIKLYPASPNTTINGKNRELKVYPKSQGTNKRGINKSNNKSFKQAGIDTITVSGRFYTGIFTYDQMETGSNNKNGVERIELFVDDTLFHSYNVHSFLFEETRAVNAIIDYHEYQRSREYYILSRRLRGDPTNFNSVRRDFGYLQFDDGKTHKLQYRVFDYKGNKTSRTFFVRSSNQHINTSTYKHINNALYQPIIYYKPFLLVRDGFSLSVDPNNLYENDEIVYRATQDLRSITQQHYVAPHRNALPPHDHIVVTLAIPETVPQSLRSKLVVICLNGKKTSACPSKIDDNIITATSLNWGSFALRIDTIPPTIRPSGFTEKKPVRGDKLSVIVGDNLSGIDRYSCTVNGTWHVVEHDGKTSSLILETKLLRHGINTLVFTVTDAVGNTTSKTFTITR